MLHVKVITIQWITFQALMALIITLSHEGIFPVLSCLLTVEFVNTQASRTLPGHFTTTSGKVFVITNSLDI